jgi:hypothetical protein
MHEIAHEKVLTFEKEGEKDIVKLIAKHEGKELSKDDADWIRCERGQKMTFDYRAKPRWYKEDEHVKCNKCKKKQSVRKPYWMCKCIPGRHHETKMAYCRSHGIQTMQQKSLVLEKEEKCEIGHNLEFKNHGPPSYDKDGMFVCDVCSEEFPYTVAYWKCVDTAHKDVTTRELCADCGCNNEDDKREMAEYYKDRMAVTAQKAHEGQFGGGSAERANAHGVAFGGQEGAAAMMGQFATNTN